MPKNLHTSNTPPSSPLHPDVAQMVESIIGCKWSLHVLACVRKGVCRPGAIERAAPGLTAKVLSERLDKMLRFGILEKQNFPEVPPRVEYRFTPFGERFLRVIDEVQRLQDSLAADTRNPSKLPLPRD
jgi:DNA-binding HxlR family transcriptional regulator